MSFVKLLETVKQDPEESLQCSQKENNAEEKLSKERLDDLFPDVFRFSKIQNFKKGKQHEKGRKRNSRAEKRKSKAEFESILSKQDRSPNKQRTIEKAEGKINIRNNNTKYQEPKN